jgi:hypothetical protein
MPGKEGGGLPFGEFTYTLHRLTYLGGLKIQWTYKIIAGA